MSPRARRSVFARSAKRRRRVAEIHSRLSSEQLEPRAMLATTATLSGDLTPYSRIPVTFRQPDGSVGFSGLTMVGQLAWNSMSGDALEAGVPASFKSFCIDGLQAVSYGRQVTFPEFVSGVATTTSGEANPITSERGQILQDFAQRFGPADNTGFTDKIDAAAFQLCTWEIIADGARAGNRIVTDLTAGQFSVNVGGRLLAAFTRAQQWLQSFDLTSIVTRSVQLYSLQGGTHQRQVVLLTESQTSTCPVCMGSVSSSKANAATNLLSDYVTGTLASGGSTFSAPVNLYRNQPLPGSLASAGDGSFGNGWSRTDAPTLTIAGGSTANPSSVSVRFSGSHVRVFRNALEPARQPSFFPVAGQGFTDRLAIESGQFVYRTPLGEKYVFNGFGASVPAAARGKLVSRSDASGNEIVFSFNPDGSTAALRSYTAAAPGGSRTLVEVQNYVYPSAGDPNAGKVSRIDIRRGDDTLVRSVGFTYFTAGATFGTPGDLAVIEIRDAANALLDSLRFRYTASASGASLLQYTFDQDAVRRAITAGVDLGTASAAAVAPFATNYYEYDANHRVTRHDAQGEGCSSCTGGIGTFTYAFAANPSPVAGSTLGWRTKTTETRQDGTQRIVYSNILQQPMLEVIRTTDGGTVRQHGTYTRYDFRNQPIWLASPEAVNLPASLTTIEQFPDLLNNVRGNYQYINDATGLIEVTTYYQAPTPTAVFGAADGFVANTAVMRGDRGTAITEAAVAYNVRTAGLDRFTLIASSTTFPTATAAGSQTTSYAYTFNSGTTQLVSAQTTLPLVSATQNGPGTASTSDRRFDASGREIWSRDEDGFLIYTQYDAQTGTIVKRIVDVDSTRTAEFQNLPAGWVTPAGGGLHLVTTTDVDALGRPVKSTDPNGSVTYRVYDDVARSTRTYVGWNAATLLPTAPITVSRRDVSGTYSESLTYAAVPAVDVSGRPTGTEPITSLQSLGRTLVNAAGQMIAQDSYTSFVGLVYTTLTATLGTEGVNFLRTRYGYDDRGNVDRVQNPAGTITHSIRDGLERLVATWVGTDDSTTDGFKWKPSNASSASNMTQVTASEYDNGAVGNSNLTRFTRFPGGAASPRITQQAFDWRNRVVVAKEGATGSPGTESETVNRPLAYTEYDNLSRTTARSFYDGDGVSIVDANADGVPDKPAAGLLRESRTSLLDSLDRTYRTTQLFVDQSSGAIGSPTLTTDMFYDRRGNVVAVYAPNSPVSQSRYDGAGRMTTSFTLGNVPSATWGNATSLTASLVLEQTEYTYDAASNVILTTNRQRFHDASTSAFGSLGTPTAGIPARVSFAASYYDAANRLTASVNVGTNGGVAYVRPGTVPARSDTALVASYTYDAAGRVQDVTDPRGIVARKLYDALGRTTATIANFTNAAAGSQSDVTTLFTFDSAGRLASRTAVQPAGTPSQTTGYIYGVSPATGSTIASNDLMAETRYPDPATGLPAATERDIYSANALGERTSFTDRAGTVHAYTYDITGRQTADAVTTLGTGVDGTIRRIEVAYDTLGRPATMTSFNAAGGGTATNQVARAFNGFGQLTSEWQAHTGVVMPATTPRVQYAFSQGSGGNHSRLTRVTYPDGYQVNYAYNGLDDAASRPTSLSGQSAGSATSVTLEAFKYLGAGTVIERSRPEVNATLSMVDFSNATADAGDKYTGLDRFGRVVDQRWTQGTTAASPVIDRYGYTYDRNSNRLSRSNALAAAFSETYAYDALNQLSSFNRSGGTTTSQQWQFDALGNWTTVTTNGVAQNRTANAQNELTQVGSSALAYSTTGNLTTDAEGRTLSYDAWNRLVSVKNAAGTEVARYEYDGLNRRIVEQVGTVASPAAATAAIRDVYYSQDWQALEERVRTSPSQVAATADTRFIWSPVYVDAMVARDRNADGNATTGTGGLEQRVYALQDANWNTTAIIAATGVPGVTAGAVINRFAYTPYGEVQALTASWATPPAGSTPAVPWAHLFQGLEFTDVTALAYFRHRDYSATLGRFIEMDPIGFSAGDNNWYRFVGNGPVGAVDPSGLCPGPCDKARIERDNKGLEECLGTVETRFDALFMDLVRTRDVALEGLDNVQRQFFVNCINGFSALGITGRRIYFICDQGSWAARDAAEDLAQRLFRTAVFVNEALAFAERNRCFREHPCADAGVRAWVAAPPGPGGSARPLRSK